MAAFPVGPSREARQEVPRVLIAEDADDNRLLVAHYLRGEAVDFHFAENGQQAVDAICNGEEFDLILMDLDMPVLDGLGAVNAIRAWERDRKLAPLPIVASQLMPCARLSGSVWTPAAPLTSPSRSTRRLCSTPSDATIGAALPLPRFPNR
jgi:CheY-like chemotaxis protein